MTIDDDDLELAESLLRERSGWGDPSPIRELENTFAAWNGSRHALSFVSGRVALRAAIDALGLRPGDEVVVPGYTCVVVVNALTQAGVTPVYADIELQTFGLSNDALCAAITPKTRAVLVHHLYGARPASDLIATIELARAHGLAVIEDCAQASGAALANQKVGNFGDIGIFSADPSKPFTCSTRRAGRHQR